jgi:hypothetical protein
MVLVRIYTLHDTQVYGRCPPAGMCDLATRVSACTQEILSWMKSNRIQLNADTTEIIWCATSGRLRQLPATSMRVGSETLVSEPSDDIPSDGIASSSAGLRQIRSIRHPLIIAVHRGTDADLVSHVQSTPLRQRGARRTYCAICSLC